MTKSHAGHQHNPDAQGPAVAPAGELMAYDEYIDTQLHTARRQVRTVDIAVGLTTLAAGTLGYFILAALVDHWVLPGGLPALGRWLALAVYLGGALVYLWRYLLPLCIHRINPVYAAHAIERSKPSLKNSLINFLLLRRRPDELSPSVFQAIEEHAATELAQVPVEASIDRTQLIKIGYVLLGLLVIAAIYKVASPKDPVKTVGRIMAPWADIAPPTRVSIVAVHPGNGTVMRGQAAKISAEIAGLGRSQAVKLIYSTADGQTVNRSLAMLSPGDGYLFECDLPEGKGGIQQDVEYRVLAGDATSSDFHLVVQAAPTIVIDAVDYAYPTYTGMVAQTVDHQGDLKAIEGTQVTLHAVANQPIKSAFVDLDCNGTDDVRMSFEDRKATATITLALKADRLTPEHASYQLRFANTQGQENLQPIRHQIEVTRDVSPEVEFLAPKRDEIELPLNVPLVCEIAAHDPDFALSRLALVGRGASTPMFERSLLDETKSGKPWQGQLRKKVSLSPKRLGLKVGDVLEYWAWAEDNKSPQANRTETTHRRARIVSPTQQETSPDALAQNNPDSSDEPNENGQPGENKAGGKSESQAGEGEGDEQAGPPPAGNDPNRAPGQDRDDQPAGDDRQPQPGQGGPADKMADRGGEQGGQQGQGEPEGQQNEEKEQGGNEQAGADQSGQGQAGKPPASKQSGQGGPSGGKSGSEASGSEPAGGGQSGSEPTGNDSGGKQGSGQDQSGKGQSGKGQSGKGQSGQEKDGQGGGSGSRGGSRSSAGKQGSQRGDSSEPVAQDGSQDGEAFDKILRRQSQQDPSGSPSGGKNSDSRGGSGSRGKSSADEKMDGHRSGEKGEADSDRDKPGQGGEKSPTAGNEAGNTSGGKKPGTGSQGEGKAAGGGDDEREAADGHEQAAGQPGDGRKPGDEKKPQPGGKPGENGGEEEQPSAGQAGEESGDQPGGNETGKKQTGKTQPGEKPAGGDQPNGKQPGEKQPGGDETDKQPGGKPDTGKTDSGKPAGEKPGSGAADDKMTPNGKGQGTDRPEKDHPNDPQTGKGGGAQNKPDEKRLEKKPGQGQLDDQQGGSQQGEPTDDQGHAGGGKPSDDRSSTTTPQAQNKPRDKSPGNKPTQQPSKAGEPPSQSQSAHQSNSQSDQEGDRSGGGGRGGGQQSQQPGPGNPGSQTEADDGGEAMRDKNGQETSDQPGGDRLGDQSTGSQGEKGSTGSKTSGGQKAGGSQPGQSSQQGTSQGKGEKQPGTEKGEGRGSEGLNGKGAGPPQGAGQSNGGEDAPPPAPVEDKADEANLAFARKATELSVQRLRDQLNKNQVDQKLLDSLQWSRADMERWVNRWETMFRRSEEKGPKGEAARMELDATLRSLGLTPHGAQISGHRKDDMTQGMKEGHRTRPPAEYQEQFRQYTRGVARGQNGQPDAKGSNRGGGSDAGGK